MLPPLTLTCDPAFLSQTYAQGAAAAEAFQTCQGMQANEIAFDADGVLQFFAIKDLPESRMFYQLALEGYRNSGVVAQHLAEIPAMAALVSGLAIRGRRPILVSSMSLSRGVAVLNGFPSLKSAFLGMDESLPVSPQILRASRQTYFAEDLARGLRALHEIQNGVRVRGGYPEDWQEEIDEGLRAIKERAFRGTLLKNPIVIALSKPEAPLPRVYVEDSREVIEPLIEYSRRTQVIRPLPPWHHSEAFFDDPVGQLLRHLDGQAAVVASALLTMATAPDFQERLHEIPRDRIPPLRIHDPHLMEYREHAHVLHDEHVAHVIGLRLLTAHP